jgi:hypothetical protein
MIYLSIFLLATVLCVEFSAPRDQGWTWEEEQVSYWKDVGNEELETAKNIRKIRKKAKNVILFMGDGMGIQ